MSRWRTVRITQELVEMAKKAAKTSRCRSLSEFVSQAIRLRLDELKPSYETAAERQAEYPLVHERLLYTHNHMWAIVTPEGNVRVGLSDYAQRHLKGITGIKTDAVGYEVKKEEPFGVVETWMFKFDLRSPVSGKIIKINETLQNKASITRENSHGKTWIAEIQPNNLVTLEEELKDLMAVHQYKTWVSKLGLLRIRGT